MGEDLDVLWAQVAHVAHARVHLLRDGVEALRTGAEDAAARSALAFDECHKLVGSLDSWGRTGGSALALRAADLFASAAPDLEELADVVQQLHDLVHET